MYRYVFIASVVLLLSYFSSAEAQRPTTEGIRVASSSGLDIPLRTAKRSAALDPGAMQVPSQPTAGLVITATYDPSITGDPNAAQIQQAIADAIAVFQALFADPITVNIYFRYAATDPCTGSALPTAEGGQANYLYYTRDWTTFRNALAADATTSRDTAAVASIPTTPLVTSILPTSANGRAVGLATPAVMTTTCTGGGTFDGIVTLNSNVPMSWTRPVAPGAYDARRVLEHEIDHVLAIGSTLDLGSLDWRPEDLFTYSSPGVRNVSATGNRYFSYDGGNTNVVNVSQDPALDNGDWQSSGCPEAVVLVQNAQICPGQIADVGRNTPEGIALDVMGYTPLATTAAQVTVAGRVMNASGSGIRNARVTLTAPDGSATTVLTNAFGYYVFQQVESGHDYLIGAAARGFTFDPRLVSVTDSLSDVDFVANQ